MTTVLVVLTAWILLSLLTGILWTCCATLVGWRARQDALQAPGPFEAGHLRPVVELPRQRTGTHDERHRV